MSQGPTPHTRCFRPSFPPGSPDANRWTPFFDAIDARNASPAPPELERADRFVQLDPGAAPFTPKRVSFTPDSQGAATAALHFDAAVVQASSFTPKNATVSHNTPGTAAQNLLLVHPVPSDVRLHNELAILPALRALDIRGQTIYLQPSRSDLALDNGVRNTRDPRQTWHTFFSALRMAGAFAPLLGAGWRYKIRPELAWMRSFRPHGHLPESVFTLKQRCARTLHFYMRTSTARCYHSTMWAWYSICSNFYSRAPRKLRKWALFCQTCLRQRKSASRYWTIASFIHPWFPSVVGVTATRFFGRQIMEYCKHCDKQTVVDCWFSDAWDLANNGIYMRLAECSGDIEAGMSPLSSVASGPSVATTGMNFEEAQADTAWDCDFDLGAGYDEWQGDLYG